MAGMYRLAKGRFYKLTLPAKTPDKPATRTARLSTGNGLEGRIEVLKSPSLILPTTFNVRNLVEIGAARQIRVNRVLRLENTTNNPVINILYSASYTRFKEADAGASIYL
jgi:hypothetical protein